jgi:hypothetical protein
MQFHNELNEVIAIARAEVLEAAPYQLTRLQSLHLWGTVCCVTSQC